MKGKHRVQSLLMEPSLVWIVCSEATVLCKRLLLSCGVAWFSTAVLFGQGLNTTQKKSNWEEIEFAFNSAVLTDGYPSLLRLAELLKQHPDYQVKLAGHADHIDSESYNTSLRGTPLHPTRSGDRDCFDQ